MGLGTPEIVFIFFAAMLLTVIPWAIALIDILRSDFRGQNDKLIWVLVVILGGFIGAIIYFFVGRSQKVSR